MTSPAIDCRDVIRELWDWLDGEMDQARLEAIRSHLGLCSGCARHVAFARDFLTRVEDPGSPAADLADLRDRVRRALGKASGESSSPTA